MRGLGLAGGADRWLICVDSVLVTICEAGGRRREEEEKEWARGVSVSRDVRGLDSPVLVAALIIRIRRAVVVRVPDRAPPVVLGTFEAETRRLVAKDRRRAERRVRRQRTLFVWPEQPRTLPAKTSTPNKII